MTKMTRLKTQFLGWIKKPNSWFSIAALVTSLITFYLVHWRSGSIQVYPADNIALLMQNGSIAVLDVPVVFLNTGSTETWKIIKDIKVKAKVYDEDRGVEELEFNWTATNRFLSAKEYERTYSPTKQDAAPTKQDGTPTIKDVTPTIKDGSVQESDGQKASDSNVVDYFVYESRKIPFGVSGRETVYKLCEFIPLRGVSGSPGPFTIEIILEAITAEGDKYKSSSGAYRVSREDAEASARLRIYSWVGRQ